MFTKDTEGHDSITHISPKLETTQMSVKSRNGKQIPLSSYNEILCIREWTCNSMKTKSHKPDVG